MPFEPDVSGRPSDTSVTYDAVAGAYERRFHDELSGKPRDRELLTRFAAAVGDPVLDVGCGPGQIGAFVRGLGRRVIGLDLSAEMTALAGSRLDAASVGDMRALPLRSGSLGGIVAFYSLIHLRRPQLGDAFRELRRVLRPGGLILVSAHEGQGEVHVESFLGEPVSVDATLYELDELVDAVTTASLTVTFAERRQPYALEGPTTRLYVEARR